MEVNFGAEILGLNGQPIGINGLQPVPDGEPAVTLGLISTNALLAQFQDEQNLSGEEKVKRFKLAQVATENKSADISVEDAALLKRLIGKSYGPLMVGRAFALIEQPDK